MNMIVVAMKVQKTFIDRHFINDIKIICFKI